MFLFFRFFIFPLIKTQIDATLRVRRRNASPVVSRSERFRKRFSLVSRVHERRGEDEEKIKDTSGAGKKTISRSRKRCFANCKASQPYVRRNVLKSTIPEATGIADFLPTRPTFPTSVGDGS